MAVIAFFCLRLAERPDDAAYETLVGLAIAGLCRVYFHRIAEGLALWPLRRSLHRLSQDEITEVPKQPGGTGVGLVITGAGWRPAAIRGG